MLFNPRLCKNYISLSLLSFSHLCNERNERALQIEILIFFFYKIIIQGGVKLFAVNFGVVFLILGKQKLKAISYTGELLPILWTLLENTKLGKIR